MSLIVLSWYGILLADIVTWGVGHGLSGYVAHRLPLDRLQHDGPVLRLRAAEAGGRVHRRRFHVDRWKDRLPEAGALFAGGMAKRSLPSRDEGGLERFAAETRRAERGHWCSLFVLPIFSVWNPPFGVLIMVIYGLLVNAPFILIQRYNRARIAVILERRRRRRCGEWCPTLAG